MDGVITHHELCPACMTRLETKRSAPIIPGLAIVTGLIDPRIVINRTDRVHQPVAAVAPGPAFCGVRRALGTHFADEDCVRHAVCYLLQFRMMSNTCEGPAIFDPRNRCGRR